ncbi:MerR family transcriptional regulator [Streptomyces sp. NRRL B-1677]|uniref:MerR family transcriptional regulator n=1 Tax=Streptomyces klenkii TaxID=1420899 RepID=A0A3B0BCW9_9ACTN|nr:MULTISPECIES: MerR family transcriptional regulator [Streptomyces]MBF6044825.1 MerR family transcriptional regulator [Streptomyces sp. NRRL B-1677]RKN71035.1 MerR family transcriptional regulator [Streptomyces klenkii]
MGDGGVRGVVDAGGQEARAPEPAGREARSPEPAGAAARQYRAAELADAAGITPRTLRFYRERKLLPAPRREGRIAWYGPPHLARLRTIAALLERGHTLGGIAELISAFECGRDVGELLGLAGAGAAVAVPWQEEPAVRLTPAELADRFGGEITPENVTASLDMGYLGVDSGGDGDEIVHVSRRLLDASTALVRRHGVPLAAVLAAGREVRAHADALAGTFTELIRAHVLPGLQPGEPATGAALDELRGIAKTVMDAEITMALDRRVRTEPAVWLGAHGAAGEPGPARPG